MASPLWIAAQMGHTGVVRELIAAGAEVDAMREVHLYAYVTYREIKLSLSWPFHILLQLAA